MVLLELELPELELLELELVELELLELELLELELLKLCDHALTNLANLIPKCPFRDCGLPAKCHRRTTFGPNRHGDPNCHGLTNQPILAMHFRDFSCSVQMFQTPSWWLPLLLLVLLLLLLLLLFLLLQFLVLFGVAVAAVAIAVVVERERERERVKYC